jgi:undecaprenyl-phosphate galactose phosphotransferase
MNTLSIPPRTAVLLPAAWFRSGLKRTCDIVLACLALLAFLPLMLAIGFVVAMDGGTVLYGHQRIGRNGRTFHCLKFRTMIVGADRCLNEYLLLHPSAAVAWRRDQKLDFDPRITGVGRMLRRSSLDELPQLLNVLRGEMSLVGPRPVTESELQERYGLHAASYLSVRPGITGLWQVSGRNRLSYSQRVALDVRYVRDQSMLQDVAILFRTVSVMLKGDGK